MLFIKSEQIATDCLSLEREDSRDNSFLKIHQIIKSSIFLLFFLGSSSLFAQRKSDIGLFAGSSSYMGDINPSRQFYSPALAIGPIFRYNFELRNSIRLNAIYHKLQGSDQDFSDPFRILRDASFNASFIDAAAIYEFNFVPYKTSNRKYNRTFYLSGGVGYHFVISTNTLTNNHFVIPFGLGYKFNAGKKLAVGSEVSVRKTFNDKIDGIENFALEGNKHLFGNNDWYTFAGIFLTYKIFNFREDCPAYK
jgi:hypothetical protein